MKNNQYKGKNNRREHYRIRYPLTCRPKLTILNEEYEVIDFSERGIKFLCKEMYEFQPGLEVQVKVTFNDGEFLDLEGEILRVKRKVAVIYFPEGVPFGRIVREQRYLKVNYPDYR